MSATDTASNRIEYELDGVFTMIELQHCSERTVRSAVKAN